MIRNISLFIGILLIGTSIFRFNLNDELKIVYNIRRFLNHSFLGNLWQKDRRMAIGISTILSVYFVIHLVKLEVFPFYLFAMFSQEYPAKELYATYSIYVDGEKVSAKEMDYRKYTYVMNTISHYDNIKEAGAHDETKVISKFTNMAGLSGSGLEKILIAPHNYEDIDALFRKWLIDYFDEESNILIEKENYSWQGEAPQLESKIKLYELD